MTPPLSMVATPLYPGRLCTSGYYIITKKFAVTCHSFIVPINDVYPMETSNSSKRVRQDTRPPSSHLMACEPICFLFKKFHQVPAKLLKQTLTDFYDSETTCEAINVLISCMGDLNIESWSRPPKRRKGSKEQLGEK